MALISLPFFMPLLLLGWVMTPREEREHRLFDSRREQEIADTWLVLYGRERGADESFS